MGQTPGITLEINDELNKLLKKYPERLKKARESAVEAAGMAWADEAKEITRADDHIDTGLYINSIGYATGANAQPLYEMESDDKKTTLLIGADVAYAEALEKRFGIMARGLDQATPRMNTVANGAVRKIILEGGRGQ